MDIEYDSSYRAFLQALFSRSTITFSQAQPILASILAAHENRVIHAEDIRQVDFDSFITTINSQISAYDFEIRSTIPQSYRSAADSNVRERVYALVNTTSDPSTQLATLHKPDEIEFVKRVLDEMFEKHNTLTREIMAVTSMQALDVARPPKPSDAGGRSSNVGLDGVRAPANQGILKSHAEDLLHALVDEGWFVRESGYYTLSPRSLMELRDWLKETYNEPAEEDGDEGVDRIKLCQACREIVTIGQRCSKRTCTARLHEHCLANFWRSTGSANKCPKCSESWTGRDFVGPKSAKVRESQVNGNERRRIDSENDDED